MIKKSLVWLYSISTYLLWAIIIVVAAVVLGLRWFVLPNVHHYKDNIAQEISRAVGQKVTIGSIQASWDGMQPHLDLRQIVVHDAQSRAALSLDHIETSLSWLSLPLIEPRLATLTIHQPKLTVRREADGTIYVAGMPMGGPSRPQFPNWLLRQSRIDVLNAYVVWEDDIRKTPPLALQDLTLQIQNPTWESFYGRHRFGLRAKPSAGASQPIDIRGNVLGRDVGQPDEWRGTVYARLEGTDVAAWRTWVDFPVGIRQGFGATQVWLDFAKGRADKVVADVVLANVVTPLGPKSPETALKSLTGRLSWARMADGQEMRAERIKLVSEGLEMQNGNVRVRNRLDNGKELTEGSIRLDEISLEQLSAFADHVSLGEEIRKALTEAAPSGLLKDFELDWGGAASNIETYGLRGQFSQLSMRPYQGIPGFSGLNGSVKASEKGGTLTFAANDAQIEVKDILRWPIPMDTLSGRANWIRKNGKLDVKVSNLAVSSPHLSGTVEADYQYSGKGRGFLDLKGKFNRADGRFAQFYYPMTLGHDTLNWLDTSILGGRGENVSVTVKGNLDEFPWDDNKKGLFEISANISDGLLHYADGWPQLEGVKLAMLFRGNRMELNAREGHLFGNQITRAKAVIPVLDTEHPVLEVTGELQSPPAELVRYLNNSPLLDAIDRFTEGMQASGNGKLAIGLRIPLSTEGIGTRVKGSYTIANGMLGGNGEMPTLEGINGRLDFTESTLRAQNVTARIFGGPAQINIESGKEGLLHIAAQGNIDGNGIRQAVASPLADKLQGSTDWTAEINARKQQADVVVKSSLVGLASSLPAPFAKGDTETLPLLIEKKRQNENQDIIAISLGKAISGRFQRVDRNGKMSLDRGEINFGGTAELPAQPGISVRGNLQHVDADQWQSLLTGTSSSPPASDSQAENPGTEISAANLTIGSLDIFGRRINALTLDAKPVSNGWRANIQSQEITGEALWIKGGNGKIVARLKSLIAPSSAPAKLSVPVEPEQQKEVQYPALDVIAENFEIKQKKLGRIELVASQQGIDWNIDKLVISNPDSTLSGNGVWHSWKRRPHTRLNLAWDINDIGKTLDRFGYPDTIKGGNADLTGNLRWPGSPHEFNVAGLGGKLKLDAKNGQFLKIRPGVGRLLGVLSLQSLPRRLAFDFRDIFSSGFSFDKIGVNASIDNGIMRSDDFLMEGPAAKVAIKGETDLARETQNLHIKVTPSISDSLSVAAFAGGPAVGVAAIVAQKLLNDPFNKLIAYEYDITGTWDDPQEVKTKSDKPAAPTPLGP
ncbi:MAG: YhdP family protein [Methylophilaceae bacterium]